MAQACILRALATSRPAEARALILLALEATGGDRTAAALRLRASGDLPLLGTDDRSRVTLNEIVNALGMGDEIRELYAVSDAARAVERAKQTTAKRVAKNRPAPS